MSVRPVRPSDREAMQTMRLLLWPDDDGADDPGETALVWEEDEKLGGFVIYSLRPCADGCDSRPVPYIEGWFVHEELRLRGIGRALISAVEELALAGGFDEIGSDAIATNYVSLAAHRKLGFERTERIQCFRKLLRRVQRADLVVEEYDGPRSALMTLFEQADDSREEIESYIERGEILVARCEGEIIGHVQWIPGDWELKSLAVAEKHRGSGIGSMLVRSAVDRAFDAGAARVVVATATADIGNLGFYQRLGFRMERVERDAFRTARGYPAIEIDCIPLRDRIWFSLDGPTET